MRVDYRYPALAIAKKRSAARAWRNLVWMHGSSEIAEVHADDAPEAAMVKMHGEHGQKTLRFHEGRFYKNTLRMKFDERLVGLETEMLVSICRKMAAEGDYGAAVYPDMGHDLWRLWREDRAVPRNPLSFPTVYESKLQELRGFDGQKLELPEDFEQAQAAEDYVSSVILIGEHLWVPVEEPMMQGFRWRRKDDASDFFHEDVSCYRRASGRPADLPAPYGRAEGITDSHDGRYWDGSWRYATLPEAEALGAGCRVLLPEAFESDHAPRRLDRAARVSVASLRRVLVEIGAEWVLKESNSLSDAYRTLRRLTTKGRAFDGDAIEKALDDFTEATEFYVTGLSTPFALPFADTGIRDLIEEALATWRSRPIALDFQPDAPAPVAGR